MEVKDVPSGPAEPDLANANEVSASTRAEAAAPPSSQVDDATPLGAPPATARAVPTAESEALAASEEVPQAAAAAPKDRSALADLPAAGATGVSGASVTPSAPDAPGGLAARGAAALTAWAEIDLPALQRRLDHEALELKEDQKSSLLNRKNLANKTKEFRKLPDEAKLSEVKPLLKLYQNEIDALANKKRAMETVFFAVYRQLAEAPDPRPVLETSLDAVAEYAEVEKLHATVARLEDELTRRADYDQLKQRLVRNEQRLQELLQTQLRQKEDELRALVEEKEANWAEREKSLVRQLEDARHQAEELRVAGEVSALREGARPDAAPRGDGAVELIARDLERAQKRIYELEKRNERLRLDLTKSQSAGESAQLKQQFTKRIDELEGENALMIARLESAQRRVSSIEADARAAQEAAARQAQQAAAEVARLRATVDATSDYGELKHEVHLLRQIQFGEEEAEGVDAAIIQRNKALTQELAEFRAQHELYVARIAELETALKARLDELAQAQLLNDRLERDLGNLQGGSATDWDNMSMLSGVSKMTGVFGRRNGSVGSAKEDNSILPIITKQRDRFRERNSELEDELKRQYATISDLKRQQSALRKDNEELYERTRFLALFKHENTALLARSRRLEPKANAAVVHDNPYRANYEQKLHPIEQFRLKEQERISSRLSPLERLFILFLRAVLATRTTRMLFAGYCLGLHLVVMVVTVYAMSYNTLMIPEVGINSSTGGVASGMAGAPDKIAQLVEQ